MKLPKILPIHPILSIDNLTLDGLSKSQINDVIAYDNKVSADDLRIDELEAQVRRLQEELAVQKRASKSYQDMVMQQAKDNFSKAVIVVKEIIF